MGRHTSYQRLFASYGEVVTISARARGLSPAFGTFQEPYATGRVVSVDGAQVTLADDEGRQTAYALVDIFEIR